MTLDEVIAAGMPAGSSVWYCPLCEWVHAQPPPDPFKPGPGASGTPLEQCISNAAAAILGEWYAEADAAIRGHMSGHSVLEWVNEVARLRAEVQAADSRRLSAENDAIRTVDVLVRKLGGSVKISDEEMTRADGELMRIPDRSGFILVAAG